MKYYAMIEGQQKGPFSLDELADAGVRPSTYVWCRDMPDWQPAEEVPDICRHFRRRIHDLMHPSSATAYADENKQTAPHDDNRRESPDDDALADIPPMFRRPLRKADITPGTPLSHEPDTDLPPQSMTLPAILATIFCFPLTGIAAIYYSLLSSRCWRQANTTGDGIKEKAGGDGADSREMKKMAHDYCRMAKMWTGITFFFGLIFQAFIIFNLI